MHLSYPEGSSTGMPWPRGWYEGGWGCHSLSADRQNIPKGHPGPCKKGENKSSGRKSHMPAKCHRRCPESFQKTSPRGLEHICSAEPQDQQVPTGTQAAGIPGWDPGLPWAGATHGLSQHCAAQLWEALGSGLTPRVPSGHRIGKWLADTHGVCALLCTTDCAA